MQETLRVVLLRRKEGQKPLFLSKKIHNICDDNNRTRYDKLFYKNKRSSPPKRITLDTNQYKERVHGVVGLEEEVLRKIHRTVLS